MPLDPQRVMNAQNKAHELLSKAASTYRGMMARPMTDEEHLAVYHRIIGDPKMMNEVLQRSGVEKFKEWQTSMVAMEKRMKGEGRAILPAPLRKGDRNG